MLPEDRTALQTQRGFPDTAIDAAKFKSARPENLQIIEALEQEFERDELITAGILIARAGQILPSSQLLEPGAIIIPYVCLDHEGVYHIRRHKMGPKGVPIQLYCAGQQYHGHGLICESEFKALAAYCFGHAAIGLPGIASFAGKHLNQLRTFLSEEAITSATVMFDNEIKNDTSLPNYKPDPEKRYDTQFYAILMAKLLAENSNINTRIATLPDEWRVNGKIDIDMALAQGHTPEQFQAVIDNAMRIDDYIEALPDEASPIVKRKLEAYDLGKLVRRTPMGYEVPRDIPGGQTEWQNISNFTMDVLSVLDTPTGMERSVKLEIGSRSTSIFRLKPAFMVRPDMFQQSLYSSSKDAQWTGNREHLQQVINLEHLRAKDAIIRETDHVGKIVGHDMWLFGNGAIVKGEIVLPDDHGVSWNGTHGWQPMRFSPDEEGINLEETKWTQRLPYPNLRDFSGVDLKKIIHAIYNNYGGKDGGHHAVTAVCWALASIYSVDLFEEFGCFPILYFSGRRESGKTTLARWILRMFGLTFAGFNAEGSTAVAIGRTLSYYSSIPCFFDECREHVMDNKSKESLFRSAYDRQSVAKGVREAGSRTISLPVRSPALLCGEHALTDPALHARCLCPEFSGDRPGYGCEYENIEAMSRTTFPKILPYVLINGPAVDTIIKQSNTWYKSLITKNFEPRQARNMAIVLAAYLCLVDAQDEIGFISFYAKTENARRIDTKDAGPLMEFLDDLGKLRVEGKIKNGVDFEARDGKLFMAFRRCWNIWKEGQSRAGESIYGPMTAVQELKKQPWVSNTNTSHRIGAIVLKTLTITPDKNLGCPESVVSFYQCITSV